MGRTTVPAVDLERLRGFNVDVWYPVEPADGDAPPALYDLVFARIVSEAAVLGVPVSDARAFPLVVFSHGNQGLRFQSYFLGEHLASHGMIVAAPDHAGNTAIDVLLGGGQPFAARDRPLDVGVVIDRMLEKNADPADPFFGRVDPERIGVAGHSFGGFTALATVGGFEDVEPDPRVKAALPISPAATGLTDEELERIPVPLLVLGGTSDITTPIDPQSVRTFGTTVVRPAFRVDIDKAGHTSFTNTCDIADALVNAGLPPELIRFLTDATLEGCAPDLIPIEEAQRITNFYATAFFKVFVDGDRSFGRFLRRPAPPQPPAWQSWREIGPRRWLVKLRRWLRGIRRPLPQDDFPVVFFRR